MKFSVIMPAYNGMHYIDAAVASVLSQSYADFEYIITDDGSTDGTRDYLEKLSKNDARVKVIFLEKNGGIGNARNTAIREADGEYLLFIDQDDFLWTEHLTCLQQDWGLKLIVGRILLILRRMCMVPQIVRMYCALA